MTFDDYVAHHLPSLLRLAGVLSGDRHISEDIVQEVLLRASQQWPRIAEANVPHAYVRRMVVNEYLSWRRKWARIIPRCHIDDERGVPDHAVQHADRAAFTDQLSALPPKQRAVLVLRYYEGLGDGDIARVLDCAEGTVRSHASRALTTLRIQLSTPEPAFPSPLKES